MAEAIAPPAPVPPAPPAPPAPLAGAGSRFDGFARRQEQKLGAGHGERELSVVFQTTFLRATVSPQSVQRVEYDTYSNLVARGVIHPPV